MYGTFYPELCNLFFLCLDVHLPTNPRFQKFYRKNRSAWLKHLKLDISMPWSSPWDTLQTLRLRRDSWPPPSARKAPLYNALTHLVSEHRSVYKTVYRAFCINFTWVAFCNMSKWLRCVVVSPPPFSSTLFSLEMTVGTCAIEVSESLSRERIWSFFIIFSSADSLRKLLAWNNFEGEGQEDKAHFLFLLWKWTWFWCPVW